MGLVMAKLGSYKLDFFSFPTFLLQDHVVPDFHNFYRAGPGFQRSAKNILTQGLSRFIEMIYIW